MKSVTYNVIDSAEFDDLVTEFIGVEGYECVADEEWNNYECHDFNGIRKENFDVRMESDYYKSNWKDFLTHKKYSYMARIILEYLVRYEYLPEGNYLIRCSW